MDRLERPRQPDLDQLGYIFFGWKRTRLKPDWEESKVPHSVTHRPARTAFSFGVLFSFVFGKSSLSLSIFLSRPLPSVTRLKENKSCNLICRAVAIDSETLIIIINSHDTLSRRNVLSSYWIARCRLLDQFQKCWRDNRDQLLQRTSSDYSQMLHRWDTTFISLSLSILPVFLLLHYRR